MPCCDKPDPDDKKQIKKVQTPEFKIIVIGDTSVGKTAIIHSYISGNFAKEKKPTIGVANQIKVVDVPNGGKDDIPDKMRLDIWDTAG